MASRIMKILLDVQLYKWMFVENGRERSRLPPHL